ncbi:hypothetical protein GmHk_04G010432 [Glycine max]|nr:hypothetical protein GmHk_04G010432 [Glycine max]
MYSSFFSTLHHIVPFDKFEVDVLSELNIAPTQLHLKAWAALCTCKVLCDVFSIIPIAPKFIYHYIMKENKKGGWISLIGIIDKAIITNSYKKFKGHFFQDFNTKALIQASMLGQSYKDMLREVGPLVSMHSIICFVARSWGIVEFWVDCAKAKRALVEVIRANKTLLLSAEESRESLTHVETKLKEYKPREKALNINLTTAKNLAKALQEKVEHLNK